MVGGGVSAPSLKQQANCVPPTHKGKSWRGPPRDVTPRPVPFLHPHPPKLAAFSSRGLGYDLQEFRGQRTEWPWGCRRPTAARTPGTSGQGCSWRSREALLPPFLSSAWQGGE